MDDSTRTLWFVCAFCGHVQSYEDRIDGSNTLPRTELHEHSRWLATNFLTREEAQTWLDEKLAAQPLYKGDQSE